jgi:hypothetical protein
MPGLVDGVNRRITAAGVTGKASGGFLTEGDAPAEGKQSTEQGGDAGFEYQFHPLSLNRPGSQYHRHPD